MDKSESAPPSLGFWNIDETKMILIASIQLANLQKDRIIELLKNEVCRVALDFF